MRAFPMNGRIVHPAWPYGLAGLPLIPLQSPLLPVPFVLFRARMHRLLFACGAPRGIGRMKQVDLQPEQQVLKPGAGNGCVLGHVMSTVARERSPLRGTG